MVLSTLKTVINDYHYVNANIQKISFTVKKQEDMMKAPALWFFGFIVMIFPIHSYDFKK